MNKVYTSIISDLKETPNVYRQFSIENKNNKIKTIPVVDGVNKLAVQVALQRGVEPSDISNFFNPKISESLPDFNIIPNLNISAYLIYTYILDRIKIGIVGDYDVDGATSVSQLYLFLIDSGVPPELLEFYVPQRLEDGYGLNKKGVELLHNNGAKLLVVLDSGTLSNEPIAFAKSLGMEVIVIDHHMTGDGWVEPDAYIVNPQLSDKCEHLKNLCTAGLVFILLQKIRILMGRDNYTPVPSLIKYSGIAALGTVADLMTLKGFNRALVKQGLYHLDDTLGLSSLVDSCAGVGEERTKVNARTLGFGIGPCINAGGRIDDCMKGSQLLTSTNKIEAKILADELFDINKKRREIQDAIEKEAYKQLLEVIDDKASVIVLRNENWHPGVIGIVASRMLQIANRPIIVIGSNGKGSGRSCHGFDLGNAIIEARNLCLLTSGGGHAFACGVGIKEEKYEEFKEFLYQKSKDVVRTPDKIDLEMDLKDMDVDVVKGLDKLAPFGSGNAVPKILLKNCFLTDYFYFGKENQHLNLLIESNGKRFKAIIWSAFDTPIGKYISSLEHGSVISLLSEVSLSSYKNNTSGIDIYVKAIVN